ncbi:hypothetical protein ZIOFF_044317 [Zingiber officinale]|uniref:Uncharacterized protein n=1 Tax=Zingiber officinale TaxID=94328 RepID=A0A8J5KZU2_ZINOF|nr:hypothetical protein ZIOFF_044317 [Zingiber officinale]
MPFAFPHQISDLGSLPSRLVVFELAFSVYEVFLLLFYFRMLRSFGEVCVLKQIGSKDVDFCEEEAHEGLQKTAVGSSSCPDDTPWDGGLPIREAA